LRLGIRTFQTKRPRRFDAYMIYSEQRERIVDYLGTHEHLAVDIELSVAPNGGLALRSGAQRFYEGPLGFSFPMLFSGVADVCEWHDDANRCFRIEVVVQNRTWGRLFGYKGHFNVEWRPVVSGVHVLWTSECRQLDNEVDVTRELLEAVSCSRKSAYSVSGKLMRCGGQLLVNRKDMRTQGRNNGPRAAQQRPGYSERYAPISSIYAIN
jgi:hypothetical protein